MEGASDTPTTPATTAKVVTAPSIAPYTKSSISFHLIFICYMLFNSTKLILMVLKSQYTLATVD